VVLGEGFLKLLRKKSGQFLLSEGGVLSLPLAQPRLTLWSDLVGVTVPMVNEGLPGRASLTVATAEGGQVVSTEGQAQFLAESLKILSLVEVPEQLLLGQRSIDLTGGIALHGVPP
jgi:hypothetical protein